MKFTVMDGASLVFDFDVTEFGPTLDVRIIAVERQVFCLWTFRGSLHSFV